MELALYQIDSFAAAQFTGNPAAVCPLDEWLPDSLMQAIASENNLSETAFYVQTGDGFHIRWFTPKREVDLCGHATLATAYVLFRLRGYSGATVEFASRSGNLTVTRSGERLTMDFPAQPPVPCPVPDAVRRAFGTEPDGCLQSEDLVVVFDSETTIRTATPNLADLMDLEWRGVVITAPSQEWDFVARFFAPQYGIPEDPVTGSAYTQLTPYWASRLRKTKFRARQLSERGGEIDCEIVDDRVLISGFARPFLQGTITIDP